MRARAVALAIASAFLFARPAPTTGPPLRDFESYYAAGATWRYQTDPYGRDVWRVERTIPGVVATRDELLPFVGPPFGLPLWSAISRLTWTDAVRLGIAASVVAISALVFAGLRLARGRCDTIDTIGACAFAAGFGPLTSAAALGQVALASCAAIALAPLALGPGFVAAAFAIALVAALQPNLALPLAALLSTRRAAIAYVSAGLVVVGGSALVMTDSGGFRAYLDVLRVHGSAERFIATQTTPSAVARALGASAAVAGAIALGIAVLASVVVLVQWASRRYDGTARLALASVALPLALPFAHEHDLTIAFVPAIVVLRRARGITWVVSTCGALAIAVDWLGLAQRPTGALETTLLTFGAALAAVAFARSPIRPYHFVPCLVPLVVAVVATIAARDPLPTWPDGLGPNFHVPATMPAPEVWAREQLASGVATLRPLWGALRLVSLLGCATLWAAASRALATPRERSPAI